MRIEKRIYNVEMKPDAETRKVEGYGAVFNRYSDDFGGWKEIIEPGAFRDAITVSDVRALFNHDPNHLLGRSTSGTLKITEDENGLRYTVDIPEHRTDILEMIKRGDLTQNSFAFTVGEANWEKRHGVDVRVIKKIAQLFDVSLVTYPAYPDAEIKRSMETTQAEYRAWKQDQAVPLVPVDTEKYYDRMAEVREIMRQLKEK